MYVASYKLGLLQPEAFVHADCVDMVARVVCGGKCLEGQEPAFYELSTTDED